MCGPSSGSPNLTIGFLGFGRISHETLKRLLAFTNTSAPPSVLYLSSRRRENQDQIDADFSEQFGVSVRRAEKEEIAEQSDVVIVLCDLNPSTKDLVNKEFLRTMKKTAVLVNCARVSGSASVAKVSRPPHIALSVSLLVTGRARRCIVYPLPNT
jgi:glyoxylate/hydroxypyruvate reductase